MYGESVFENMESSFSSLKILQISWNIEIWNTLKPFTVIDIKSGGKKKLEIRKQTAGKWIHASIIIVFCI